MWRRDGNGFLGAVFTVRNRLEGQEDAHHCEQENVDMATLRWILMDDGGCPTGIPQSGVNPRIRP